MGSLNDIVTVNITAAASPITRPGYGVLMIADYHTRYVDRIRFYPSGADGLAALLADGFTVNDAAYKAHAAASAQNPAPERIAIGRRANAPDLQIDFTPNAVNSKRYELDYVGTAGQTGQAVFTSDGTATPAEIVAGLVTALNTAAVGITATNVGPDLTVRCKAGAPGTWFAVAPSAASLAAGLFKVEQNHADPGIAADLAAIALANGDFYGVTLTTEGKAEILAAAAWVESNERVAVFPTQDTDVINGVAANVALTAKTNNEFRSHIAYKRRADQFYGAALLGSVLPWEPGQIIFAFRSLAGQEADALTSTHVTNLKAANAGWFVSYAGRSVSQEGKSAAGEYLDAIRDRDWLKSNMQINVVDFLTSNNKVPFTDRGGSAVLGVVAASLQQGVTAGVLADDPAPVVQPLKVASVAPADKAARKFRPVRWSATMAGAIQFTDISGNVTN